MRYYQDILFPKWCKWGLTVAIGWPKKVNEGITFDIAFPLKITWMIPCDFGRYIYCQFQLLNLYFIFTKPRKLTEGVYHQP